MRNLGTFEHLCSIILQSFHKGLGMLVGEMSVKVTRGCLLRLVLWLRHGAGMGGLLMGKCGDMQGQFGLFRKTGEAALWVCWRGGCSYDGVYIYYLLLPLGSLFATMHACLTPAL